MSLHTLSQDPSAIPGDAIGEVPSGLPAVGQIAWGTHICQFYRSARELADVLVPYFRAGLENREKCLWIASEPLPAPQAREQLLHVWPEAQAYLRSGQLQILHHDAWYTRAEQRILDLALSGWLDREEQARQEGYRGLRITGNTSWLKAEDWADFCTYEATVERAFRGRRIVALCSYTLADRSPSEVVDVLRNHDVALVHRGRSVDAVRAATATLSALERSGAEAGFEPLLRWPDAALGDGADPAPERTVERGWSSTSGAAEYLFSRLHAVSLALVDASSLSDVARVLENELRYSIGANHAALAIAKKASAALRMVGPVGAVDRPLADGPSLLGRVFETESPIFLESQRELEQEFPARGDRLRALASVPVKTRRVSLGALEVGFTEPRSFSPAEKGFLDDVAKHAATAIDRILVSDALRDANQRKDQFLAALGHELRNPLAPIVMSLEIIKHRSAGTFEKECETIERQVGHLTRLVEDLLDVSRIGQGKIELRMEEVELASVLVRATEIALPLICERNHKLTKDVPSTGLRISVDVARFAQAVGNVLLNAAKYTASSGHIHLGCTRADGVIEVSVSDSGEGIPPDMLERVFDPFVQLAGTNERTVSGLGLGLALVKTLMELHGGSVHVFSEGPGMGSTFALRIPDVLG